MIEAARAAGARRVVIDTGVWMARAQDLYRSFRFEDIAPYPGTEHDPSDFGHLIFMELRL